MDKLLTLCRFIGSVASYYITPIPPDFEIIGAEAGGTDITPELLSWLALQRPENSKPWGDADRLVIQYKYKGNGPFLIYFEPEEEFVFPPEDASKAKPIEYCLVSAELERKDKGEEEEPLDISERGNMFAGPSGRWDGRLQPRDGLPTTTTEAKRKKELDLKLLYPDIKEGDTVIISFANGDEIQLSA